MSFHSGEYGLFLGVIFLLGWLLHGRRRGRLLLLLAGSWFFYSCWDVRYLSLILASTLLDWWAGGRLGRLSPAEPRHRRRRRLLLLASLAGNLGLLGVFKYHGFFRENLAALLAGLGVEIPRLDVLLPVGISFYTFQTLSYTIDIYRGRLAPARTFLEFALFVAFFPQLVAGPIVRAADFLPQLDLRPRLAGPDFSRGLFRIAEGLGKKVLIADVLALGLVDRVFAPGGTAAGLEALLGVYAYALQIYCDFAGYSDIALGSALLLGFRLPENFDAPYQARSIQEFWRRWHISLSTWLRDYLYIPLGGSRRGPARTYANLMLTMALGGLWHGSSWSFVAWGSLHGLLLAAGRLAERQGVPPLPGRLGRAAATALTFHLVCLGWVFFRANDFGLAWTLLGRILSGPWTAALPAPLWLALGAGLAAHFLPGRFKTSLEAAWCALPAPCAGAAWALLIGLIALARTDAVPFIYFQF